MTIAKAYAEYVTDLGYDDLPNDVVDYTKKLMLDAIGIALGAEPRAISSEAFINGVDSLANGGDATAFVTDRQLEPEYAALLNGALVHSLDYDDTHRGASHHPGAAVIPAAIAAAETVDHEIDGEELLTAIVAGYEVDCRLGMAINPESHYDRGFHSTGTCGTFGATAAAAKVTGLDVDELTNAFGLNGSQAAGSMQFLSNGAWNKRAHPGLAAHSGILSVAFAGAGFYGSEAPIEGEDGFLAAYSDEAKPELATAGLGEKFELLQTGMKPYPCCRYMHPALDALVSLQSEESIEPESVERTVVELPQAGTNIVGHPIERKQNPQSFVDAQFSMPFGVALAITQGEAGINTFLEASETGHSEEFEEIMRTTEVESTDRVNEPFPERWSAHVIVEAGGKQYNRSIEYAKGEPENSMSWGETAAKFEELTAHLPLDLREEVLDVLQSLEHRRTEDLMTPLAESPRTEEITNASRR
jgi:2-methylcitrate dehydratase PrpD